MPSIRRLFLSAAQIAADPVVIAGADFHHLVRVLRVQPGDALLLLDNTGCGFHARVTAVGKAQVAVRVSGPAELPPEPAVHIVVAQAPGKGDRFEQVIQHGTEAGACAFLALETARTVVRLGRRDEAARLARWQLIARGAAEQSGRARIPVVCGPQPLAGLADTFAEYDAPLMLHHEGEALRRALATCLSADRCEPARILLMVGPEGGFAPGEVEAARAAGSQVISLGPHTLRTETAALVAISQILYHATR